jgi:hypothetical protein
MHVFHTAGVPPKTGRSILAHMGSTKKRRPELRIRADAKSQLMGSCTNNQLLIWETIPLPNYDILGPLQLTGAKAPAYICKGK